MKSWMTKLSFYSQKKRVIIEAATQKQALLFNYDFNKCYRKAV